MRGNLKLLVVQDCVDFVREVVGRQVLPPGANLRPLRPGLVLQSWAFASRTPGCSKAICFTRS